MKKSVLFISLITILFLSCTTESEIEKVCKIKAQLGEGAIWDYKNQQLFWVDIDAGELHIHQPSNNSNKTIKLGEKVGTIVPTSNNNALVALEDGIYQLDLEKEIIELMVNPEDSLPANRFNDGKCDPAGNLWVGSIKNKNEKTAALYRINHQFEAKTMIEPVRISNGIVWSLDYTKMYYIDTPTKKVVEYQYDVSTGEISSPRDAILIPKEMGSPDGSTIDSEGMIWIAMWGGASVTRWNPETGEFLQKIDVPAKNVTSCAFGGKKLDVLYITSAAKAMKKEDQAKYPDAGSLFKIKLGVKGVKAFYFGEKISN